MKVSFTVSYSGTSLAAPGNNVNNPNLVGTHNVLRGSNVGYPWFASHCVCAALHGRHSGLSQRSAIRQCGSE